ncbi:hypothetical protein [Halalkalibacter krulwichiae]|uniref:Uncharacterized protein n=1 Tax=Halalkalibacter krulwichiae TaxID=199441 RepID=A0A1X9MEI6_9BACI|nr:hypothetical protein [Halalkalibacter krulwichiae]ARK31848.1 hypothetical protein BkAM31D_19525 [Halalkalibacter krulwichiae]
MDLSAELRRVNPLFNSYIKRELDEESFLAELSRIKQLIERDLLNAQKRLMKKDARVYKQALLSFIAGIDEINKQVESRDQLDVDGIYRLFREGNEVMKEHLKASG